MWLLKWVECGGWCKVFIFGCVCLFVAVFFFLLSLDVIFLGLIVLWVCDLVFFGVLWNFG